MKFVAIVLGVLAALALAVFALVRQGAHETLPEVAGDPALAFYTSGRSDAYGGIDRWARYGMHVEVVTASLAVAGYRCELPHEPIGIKSVTCTRHKDWPARSLTIEASIDYRQRGRLVAASARSELLDDWGTRFGPWLRARGWIEPQTLQVRGYDFDSVERLGQFAVDAIRIGTWNDNCVGDLVPDTCRAMAQARRTDGFPALSGDAASVRSAADVIRLMEAARLIPVAARGADEHPEDSLLVRVAKGRMWLDFAGGDLGGREAKVSVALDSIGGVPVELVATLGGQSRSIKLAGLPRTDNVHASMLLLPERAVDDGDAVFANWLDMPNETYPVTFTKLGDALAKVDPAFLAGAIQAALGKALQSRRAEDELELYPVLHTIEERAAVLRQVRMDSWMPSGTGERMILEAWPNQPVLRVAWALAKCPPEAPRECMRSLSRNDTEASTLLHAEVAALLLSYSGLPDDNPLRVHLGKYYE